MGNRDQMCIRDSYKDRIYFGTPDAHLLCLNAGDGKKIWDVAVADVKFGYYVSVAPIVVKDRIIVGTSGDQTNIPHFLEAFDPETGAVVWRTDSLPKPGGPGSETWPNAKAMSHGGGPMWLSGTYDADLNLLYWGTGNPHPVLDGQGRAGADLYTCSIPVSYTHLDVYKRQRIIWQTSISASC